MRAFGIDALSFPQFGIFCFESVLFGLQLLDGVRVDLLLLLRFGHIVLELDNLIRLFPSGLKSPFKRLDFDTGLLQALILNLSVLFAY